LFNDTFINYFEPALGLRAVELLEAGGYDVVLANAGCCQRTRMSKGLLHQARSDGLKTMQNLAAFADQGLPIVFIEPSCASAVLDDLPDLLDDPTLGERIRPHAMLIDQFLAEQLDAGKVRVAPQAGVTEVVVHTHCHQKALAHTDATRRVLDHAKGLVVHEIDAGCCGMAGSFGYEHHDLSLAIGERRLFPAVTEANARNATICANGTSCRHQIHDGLTIDAKHLIELIELHA
jgi:Fe-S oxidoreductase